METSSEGLASTSWTLGSRAGAGSNQVRATAVGVAGEVSFTAVAETAEPERIHVAAGDRQRGAVGRLLPRPLEALVLDTGKNPVAGVAVTFEVAEGGGHFGGGAETIVAETDRNGRASVPFYLGGLPGFDHHLVTAGFEGMDQRPVIFKASGFLLGDPQDTRITGVVLGPADQPVPGIELRISETGTTTTTDTDGQFRFSGVPPGRVTLDVDGSTAQLPGTWSHLEFDLVTLPGVENTLERPIYVLPIDVGHGVYVDEETGGTATLAEVPGFALEVAPGSVSFPDGSKSGVVSVTAVKTDKIPMAPGSGMQPRLIVTVQPCGARFDPPARVTFPNAVDFSDPAAPVLVGSVATRNAQDVALHGTTAWLADFDGGLRSVDFTDPSSPRLTADVPLEFGGIPFDVTVAGTSPAGNSPATFAFTAEVLFADASVPIVEVSDPESPLPRDVLVMGGKVTNGTGVAVDGNFVYLTASEVNARHAATGSTRWKREARTPSPSR